jgi:hypothetical protein
MRKALIVTAVLALLCVSTAAQAAYVWNFANESDYYFAGSASFTPGGGSATIAAQTEDSASVFAMINTQAPGLRLGDITGGSYTVSGLNNTGAVYGSLYLSPTGSYGSDVLILLSPMTWTGSSGSGVYTFDLSTHADYRTRINGDWSVYDPARSGSLADVITMINNGGYNGYAAFFGPQIGMSGTSNTSFYVSEIQLQAVPIPAAVWLLGSGLVGLVAIRRKRTRS